MNTENNTHNILLSGFQRSFLDFANQLFDYHTDALLKIYDIIVMSEAGGEIDGEVSCEYVICPQSLELGGKIKCNGVITCGMNTRCTLSFSSIAYDKALLSVNRRIDHRNRSILQCEKHVDYYECLTVYENLVLQGLQILTI